MLATKHETIAKLRHALEQCHDEADHVLGTEAEDRLEVALQNAKAIKEICKRALLDGYVSRTEGGGVMQYTLVVDKRALKCRMPGTEGSKRKFLAESQGRRLVIVSNAGGFWSNNGGRHYSKAHFEVFVYEARNESPDEVFYTVSNCVGVMSWDKLHPANPFTVGAAS